MYRTTSKIRVKPDGMVEVIDPCLEDLDLLKALDQDYRIVTAPLHGFTLPRFQALRNWQIELSKEHISDTTTDALMKIHDGEMHNIKKSKYGSVKSLSKGMVTLLDLKIELARRELMVCRLCGRNCGINRLQGHVGECGLGSDAYLGDMFIHIAEEPPINPSLLVELYGCGMRCKFCQKSDLHVISNKKVLTRDVWKGLPIRGARSMSFIGGNPDESIYSILRFINTAPPEFNLPIVWNCHGFGNKVVYRLLDGVVDAYIPDFKYGNNRCAGEWSGVKNYMDTVHACINEMVSHGVPVFARILILPGHGRCCHTPAIRWLKDYKDRVVLNLMEQYFPETGMADVQGAMAARPNANEIKMLQKEARKAGLSFINKGGNQ